MDTQHPHLPGIGFDVRITRNPRARRLILRLATKGDGVEVVVPKRASQREIAHFLRNSNDWIEQHRKTQPPHVPFAPGKAIPIEGVKHHIRLSPGQRGLARRELGEIVFTCQPEHLARRVTDYLIREARAAIMARVTHHAKRLLVKMPKVTLRDTRTRWGSCSDSGALSFSWRLIMAPSEILDYVVAHEVAHLQHLDHGPKFWVLCRKLAPQTDEAKKWLAENGPALHRYG